MARNVATTDPCSRQPSPLPGPAGRSCRPRPRRWTGGSPAGRANSLSEMNDVAPEDMTELNGAVRPRPGPSGVEEVAAALAAHDYLADEGLATAVFLALTMRRPLLLEGEAGVGKTEVAKVRSPAGPAASCCGSSATRESTVAGGLRMGLRTSAPAPASGRGERRRRQSGGGRAVLRALPRAPAPAPGARAGTIGPPPVLLSTRSTGPTTNSRRSCSRSCPTTPSRCPSSARSGRRCRRSSCSRPIAPVTCTTPSSGAASTTGWSIPASSGRWRSSRLRAPEAVPKLARQIAGAVEALREMELVQATRRRRDNRLGCCARCPRAGDARRAQRRRDAGRRSSVPGGSQRVRVAGLGELVRAAVLRGRRRARSVAGAGAGSDRRRARPPRRRTARERAVVAFARCLRALGLDVPVGQRDRLREGARRGRRWSAEGRYLLGR